MFKERGKGQADKGSRKRSLGRGRIERVPESGSDAQEGLVKLSGNVYFPSCIKWFGIRPKVEVGTLNLRSLPRSR